MLYDRMFRFLFCSPTLEATAPEDQRLRQIMAEVERAGFNLIKAPTIESAEFAVQTDAAIGCVILDPGPDEPLAKVNRLISFLSGRGLEIPTFIVVRRHALEAIPVSILSQTKVTGYIFIAEDTPEFIARKLVSNLKQYASSLKTPFFGAMVDYAEQANEVWTCPGHNGGVFYQKSPIGRVFVEHLGEAVFRNDLDNSVIELGDLLVHEGPALEAQKAAAEIFGADRTYFVLNGTSTSNKVALSALVAPGDLVLFDRNNHKAAHHGALLLGGGIPVYLETDRNAFGMIGPIDFPALDEARIREKIRSHPLIKDPQAWRRERPFRVGVIEQCTYDGTIYNAGLILEKLGPLCDYILFDEAWAGFMKFHPLFRGRFAMGLEDLSPHHPGILATQSTHKQLAGFSQASQIHVKDRHLAGQSRKVEHRRFNETFLLHASTSPFYPLFASLDVGAQMMKGRPGHALWDDTIRLGIELRKKIRALKREFENNEGDPANRWFFDPFVPDKVPAPSSKGAEANSQVPWEELPTDLLAADPQYWTLEPGATWHGFSRLARGYAMTDPNKLTLLTPGFDRSTGAYAEHGIPASVLAEFLRENRIVPEKNDFNSILFLLTPGLESSKAGTLLSALVAFKRLHDGNSPLEEVIPSLVSQYQSRYAGVGLRDHCQEMHAFYREHNTRALQHDQFRFEHFPEMVMTAQEAMHRLTQNKVDYVPIDEATGRVAATLALVYPPGIAVVVPGERYDDKARPMLDYFKMFERGGNLFPGFANEIQGVYREPQPNGTVRLYTYVVRE